GDHRAWSQFAEMYVPLVYGYVRKQGLQDADAADLAQEVLHTVSAAIRTFDYDPARGTFRAWLFTVVRNKLRDWRGRQARPGRGTGESGVQRLLEEQPAPDDERALWEAEFQRQLYAWAAERVSAQVGPSTWQAFHRTAIEGCSGKDVAAE